MTDPDGAAVRGDPSMEQANIIGSADPGSQFQVLDAYFAAEFEGGRHIARIAKMPVAGCK